jgi:hypothetical protein
VLSRALRRKSSVLRRSSNSSAPTQLVDDVLGSWLTPIHRPGLGALIWVAVASGRRTAIVRTSRRLSPLGEDGLRYGRRARCE